MKKQRQKQTRTNQKNAIIWNDEQTRVEQKNERDTKKRSENKEVHV